MALAQLLKRYSFVKVTISLLQIHRQALNMSLKRRGIEPNTGIKKSYIRIYAH